MSRESLQDTRVGVAMCSLAAVFSVSLLTLWQCNTALCQHNFTVIASWESYSFPIIQLRFPVQLSNGVPSGPDTNNVYFRLCRKDASLTWPRCDNSSWMLGEEPNCQETGGIALACRTSQSHCNVPLPSLQDWYMFRVKVDGTVSRWTTLCDPDGLLRMVTSSTTTGTTVGTTVRSTSKQKSDSDSQTSTSTTSLEVWQLALIAAGGVLLLVVLLIILICCGCFQSKSNKYDVQSQRQKSRRSNDPMSSYQESVVYGSRSTNPTISMARKSTGVV
jgi:hypothetical protein